MKVKKQEDELLEARSLPLRHYLMKYVMPTLRNGLVACSQVNPDDPIDFLVPLDFFLLFFFLPLLNIYIFIECTIFLVATHAHAHVCVCFRLNIFYETTQKTSLPFTGPPMF